MTEKDKEFEEHMKDSQFRHVVLMGIEGCKNELNSKTQKDFDSLKDYGEWLTERVRDISIYIALMKRI